MHSTAEAELKLHNFVGTQIKILMDDPVENMKIFTTSCAANLMDKNLAGKLKMLTC